MSDTTELIPRERLEQMLARAELAESVTLPADQFKALVKQAMSATVSNRRVIG